MEQNQERLPTLAQIKELLSYLPKLYAEGFSPVKKWNGGKTEGGTAFQAPWPDYDPVVTAFFRTLAQNCWADYNYLQFEHRDLIRNEDFVKTANLAQIKTILTFITRAERFGDGAWETAIEDGDVRRLLERLDEIRAEMES